MSRSYSVLAAALAASIAFVPAVALTTSSATPAYAAPAASASAATADWIAGQLPQGYATSPIDGSANVSLTVDTTLALFASGSHLDKADQGVQAVIAGASDYLELNTDKNPAGKAAKLAILADAAGIDPTNFGGHDLIAIINKNAAAVSGDPFNSALIVLALGRTGQAVDVALPGLLATQVSEGADAGAFGYANWPDQDSTGLALQALSLAPQTDQVKAATSAALGWLDRTAVEGKYWATYSPVNTSGLVIPALAANGVDVSAELAWLRAQELADGSLPPALDGTTGDLYATVQAALALYGTGLATVAKPAAPEPAPSASVPTATVSIVTPTPEPSTTEPSTAEQSTDVQSTAPAPTKNEQIRPSGLPTTGVGVDLVSVALVTSAAAGIAAFRLKK